MKTFKERTWELAEIPLFTLSLLLACVIVVVLGIPMFLEYWLFGTEYVSWPWNKLHECADKIWASM